MTVGSPAGPGVSPRRGSRRAGALALGLGLLALAAAVGFALSRERPAAERVTLTAGAAGTSRSLVARSLAREVEDLGTQVEIVEESSEQTELSNVDSGSVDFGLVSGAFRIEPFRNVRQVAPLYVEALHLLVKNELAGSIDASLAGLRGRTIEVGPRNGASAGLAGAVLAFAEVPLASGAGAAGVTLTSLEPRELEELARSGAAEKMPDALFHLGTVPSRVAQTLLDTGLYRLVPLPFADAIRMSALVRDDPRHGLAAEIERSGVVDSVIPGFVYGTDPPSPPEAIHTLGTRLLLVAHQSVSPETVGRVLEAVFRSRFARIVEPPLDRSLLALPRRLRLHPGTLEFEKEGKPVITADNVDEFSNTLSVLGALVGGSIALWSAWQQRKRARANQLFGEFMLRVAEVERKAVEIELSASQELPPLVALQRDLLQLQGEALERFASGELGGQSALADLLAPVNAARDHVGDLLLHVRENIEEEAQAQGRPPGAVWQEAIAKARQK
jgi:NMT1-like family